MADEPSRLDEVALEPLFAWGRLFRGVGVATDPQKLILAVLGLIVFQLGRGGIDQLLPGPVPTSESLLEPAGLEFATDPGGFQADLRSAPWRLTEPVRLVVEPFVGIFAIGSGWRAFLRASLSAVWGTLVWGFFGGAIARIAVVQVARSERIGIPEALRFAWHRWLSLVGTPLVPLLGVACFTVFCAVFGLLYWLPGGIGPTLAGIFAVFPLLAGLVMTIILVPLAVGWPLMVATVACDGEDGFDALSRSYSYVNQRLGRYAAALAVAWGLGILGLLVVDLFARTMLHMTHWALSFGAPDEVLRTLFQGGATPAAAAGGVHTFWLTVVALVAHGWIYGYFWTSAVIVYLILRQDVDGTPWHAIAPPEKRPFEFASEPAGEPPAAVGSGDHPPAEPVGASSNAPIAPDVTPLF